MRQNQLKKNYKCHIHTSHHTLLLTFARQGNLSISIVLETCISPINETFIWHNCIETVQLMVNWMLNATSLYFDTLEWGGKCSNDRYSSLREKKESLYNEVKKNEFTSLNFGIYGHRYMHICALTKSTIISLKNAMDMNFFFIYSFGNASRAYSQWQ